MTELLLATGNWPVAAWLRTSATAYPFVSAAHILSIGLLAGAIITLDLRLLGVFRKMPADSVAGPLTAVAGTGLLATLVTGVLLFSVQPSHYLDNQAFLLKLAIIAAGLVTVLFVRTHRQWRQVVQGGQVTPLLRVTAGLSMLIWITAILAGRWIAFV